MKKSLIVIGIIVILLIVGFIVFQFLKQSPSPQTVEGEETLQVQVFDSSNTPMPNLEVDLWTSENINGPPSAGISTTDNSGIVIFKLPEGEYMIGFNSLNFPAEFVYPEKTLVNVEKGENSKTINLVLKWKLLTSF